MALNLQSSIFDADPDAAPREPKEYVGPEFAVACYEGAPPNSVKLAGYLFKVAHPDTADAVKELLGGAIADVDHKRYTTSVQTDRQSLDVIITDVSTRNQMWNGSTLVHECTGSTFLSDPPGRENMVGQPCDCADRTVRERKDAAKDKYGPRPATTISFKLADDPELGTGEMRTGSWDLAGEIETFLGTKLAAAEAADPAGEIAAELDIKQVEFTITKGKNKGTLVQYQYPTLRNIRPLNDAVAE